MNFRAKNRDFDQKQNYQKLKINEFWQFMAQKFKIYKNYNKSLIFGTKIRIPNFVIFSDNWFFGQNLRFSYSVLSIHDSCSFLTEVWFCQMISIEIYSTNPEKLTKQSISVYCHSILSMTCSCFQRILWDGEVLPWKTFCNFEFGKKCISHVIYLSYPTRIKYYGKKK